MTANNDSNNDPRHSHRTIIVVSFSLWHFAEATNRNGNYDHIIITPNPVSNGCIAENGDIQLKISKYRTTEPNIQIKISLNIDRAQNDMLANQSTPSANYSVTIKSKRNE